MRRLKTLMTLRRLRKKNLSVGGKILAAQYGPLKNCLAFSMGVNPSVLNATQNSPTYGE
jgi:hypothetical protein